MFGADGLTEESSSRMISLFRKYIVLRPALTLAVVTGIFSCLLLGAPPAWAQVATRTQLATQQEDGADANQKHQCSQSLQTHETPP